MTALAAPVPPPDSRDAGDTLGLIRGLYDEASREKRPLIPRWNSNYRLTRNRAYSEWRAAWLPSPASSEVWPALATIAAYVTSQRPRLYPSPYLPDRLPDRTAPSPDLLGQMAQTMGRTLESWWATVRADRQARTSVWDALVYGTGFLKTGWDPTARDGAGDVSLRRVDPYRLLPDPAACDLDDLRYLLEVGTVPLYEVRQRFPETWRRVKTSSGMRFDGDERPDLRTDFQMIPQGQLGPTNRTGEFPGTAASTQARYGMPGPALREDYSERVNLVEAWVRDETTARVPVIVAPGVVEELEVDVPEWRYVAVGGGALLADLTRPFPHGQLPYARIPYQEVGEFWAPPLIEHIDQNQVALNRILAALQMNLELAGNPILVDTVQSGLSRTRITNRPGTRLTEGVPGSVRWLAPPPVTGEMLHAVAQYRESIDRTVGVGAVSRGESMRRREPMGAVDVAIESASTRLGDLLSSLEDAYGRVATQAANLISRWYVEPRTIPVSGGGDSPSSLELPAKPFAYPFSPPGSVRVRDLPVDWHCFIEAGSSLPLSHQSRVSEALSLMFAGVVDSQYVLETTGLPGWRDILQRMQQNPAPAPEPRRR